MVQPVFTSLPPTTKKFVLKDSNAEDDTNVLIGTDYNEFVTIQSEVLKMTNHRSENGNGYSPQGDLLVCRFWQLNGAHETLSDGGQVRRRLWCVAFDRGVCEVQHVRTGQQVDFSTRYERLFSTSHTCVFAKMIALRSWILNYFAFFTFSCTRKLAHHTKHTSCSANAI